MCGLRYRQVFPSACVPKSLMNEVGQRREVWVDCIVIREVAEVELALRELGCGHGRILPESLAESIKDMLNSSIP